MKIMKPGSHHCLFCIVLQHLWTLNEFTAAGCRDLRLYFVLICKILEEAESVTAFKGQKQRLAGYFVDLGRFFVICLMIPFMIAFACFCIFRFSNFPQSIEASSGHLCRAWRGVASLRSVEILRPSHRLILEFRYFRYFSAFHIISSLSHIHQGHCLLYSVIGRH